MKPFSYADTGVPDGYACTTCGVRGCKLWREYQTFLDHPTLECCDCASKSEGKDVSDMDDEGRRLEREDERYGLPLERSDQIGWRVPAVPTEDGTTFWGYTSVPADGVAWWKALPNRV